MAGLDLGNLDLGGLDLGGLFGGGGGGEVLEVAETGAVDDDPDGPSAP
jgi:hypothetical protein